MIGLFKLLPIGAQLAIAAGLVALAAGGYYAWRSDIFNDGVAHEAAAQRGRDNEAVQNAREGAADVRGCFAAGGVWSDAAGLCHRR